MRLLGLALLLLLPTLCACSEEPPDYRPVYGATPAHNATTFIFAPHPLMNPQKMADVYGAMLDRFNRELAAEHVVLKLEASTTYAAFNDKLVRGAVHFALPNPYQTVLSQDFGYEIFGKTAPDDDFRGIILVRRDSPIKNIMGLKGARVSFPAPTALAATLMPELFMKEHGLNPVTDITPVFVGTHDSVMMNVCLGVTQAGCTWPSAWMAFQKDNPDLARRIEVRWKTDSLPNNGLIALKSVPERVRKLVAGRFLHLSDTAEGRRLLALTGAASYVPADNATFAPVHAFIKRYDENVRKLRGLHE